VKILEFAHAPIANIKVAKRDYISYVLFIMFFCSGFCSLLYQVIWLRLAFAHFGIITPVLSVVISVFMLGLTAARLLPARASRHGAADCE
jgi:cytochrome c oxidase subunit IV